LIDVLILSRFDFITDMRLPVSKLFSKYQLFRFR